MQLERKNAKVMMHCKTNLVKQKVRDMLTNIFSCCALNFSCDFVSDV